MPPKLCATNIRGRSGHLSKSAHPSSSSIAVTHRITFHIHTEEQIVRLVDKTSFGTRKDWKGVIFVYQYPGVGHVVWEIIPEPDSIRSSFFRPSVDRMIIFPFGIETMNCDDAISTSKPSDTSMEQVSHTQSWEIASRRLQLRAQAP
jgi:hypothetical protein